MTERIELLIAKFFSDSLTDSETNELIQWVNTGENLSVFKQYVALHFNTAQIKVSQEDHSHLWQSIKSSLPKPSRNKYWGYAAALIVLLGTIGYFYFFKSAEDNNPKLVQTKPIGTIGKDQAVLTLNDGSTINLSQDQTYFDDHRISDGKTLVYKNHSIKENQQVAEKPIYNYLNVPRSGQFFIELSDKTKVWLNSESQLKYPIKFLSGQDRVVELVYGEAYFEVSPSAKHNGAAFKVVTKNQDIKVLGTEFNVKAYKDEDHIYTTLVSGKVQLSNGKIQAELAPGQQAVLSKHQSNFGIYNVAVNDHISWKEGIFSFEGKTLEEIMKVISRWYDVTIVFENPQLKNIRFVGVFNKYQSLNHILNSIKETNFIHNYTVKNNIIILK